MWKIPNPTTMLWHVTLPESGTLDGQGDPAHFAPFQIALEGMCKLNEWHMRRALKDTEKGIGVPVPPLYRSGIRYAEDDPGREDWRDCYVILKRGKADCDGLVAYRVGELRAAGIPCEPVLKWQFVPAPIMIAMQRTAAEQQKWCRILGWKISGGKVVPTRANAQAGIWMVHCLVRYFGTGAIEDPSKILGMGGTFTNTV